MKPCFAVLAAAALGIGACHWGIDPEPFTPALAFEPPMVRLGTARDTSIALHNGGARVGEVSLLGVAVGDSSAGAALTVTPATLSGLGSGDVVKLRVTLETPSGTPPGAYVIELVARAGGTALAGARLTFEVP